MQDGEEKNATLTARKRYAQRPDVKLKRYIKNHDPEYLEKRHKYAKLPNVKERRKALNKRRRQLCSTMIGLCKLGKIKDEEGKRYMICMGRLIHGGKVIQCDKRGNVTLKEFKDTLDLDEAMFDMDKSKENDPEFLDLLDKYLKGEIVVEKEQNSITRQIVRHGGTGVAIHSTA
jgi:hypothetical protein